MTANDRLEHLLTEASKLPANDRKIYLDRECKSDLKLRNRIEQLLQSLDLATEEGFLTTPPQALMPGTQLGHYKLLRVIGVGSSGIVYEAIHRSLNQRRAIKVLNDALVLNTSARERFLREIRAVGELTHPNIVSGTDACTSGPPFYIVTEYLDGVSLKDAFRFVAQFPIPVATDIIRQIACGLAELSAKSMAHRDLSPSNVFLTSDGVVKLLDLGLARYCSTALKPEQWHTTPGTPLGNPAYMAPEQYSSPNHIDTRSDLYALGCIAYQMFAGHVPFEDQGAVAREDFPLLHASQSPTPLTKIRSDLSLYLDGLVMRLLAKKPDDRFQTAEDMLQTLGGGDHSQEVKEFVSTIPHPNKSVIEPTTILPHLPQGRTRFRAILFLCIVVFGLGTFAILQTDHTTRTWESRPLTVALGRELTPCFSNDGQSIAYAWGGADGKNFDIYVKRLTDSEPQRISTNPAMELAPTWSPDDRNLAYWRHRDDGAALVSVSLADGREEILVHVREKLQHLDWSPDGRWLSFATTIAGSEIPGLYCWDVAERELIQLAKTPQGWNDYFPRSSPDGSEIAFIRKEATYSQTQQLCILSRVRPTEPRIVWSASGFFRGVDWTPDGTELIVSFNRSAVTRLWRIAKSGGKPSEIRLSNDYRLASPVIAKSGRRMAFVCVADEWTVWRQRLVQPLDKIPAPESLFATSRSDDAPAYSPDGKQIAFASDRSGDNEIWLYDIPTRKLRQLTQFRGPDVGSPQWHPDGQQIVFDSTRDGVSGIYIVSLNDPLGNYRRVDTGLTESVALPSWAANGNWLVFQTRNSQNERLWKVPVMGGIAIPITTEKSSNPRVSSDRNRIYCLNNQNRVSWVNFEDGRLTEMSDQSLDWNRWTIGRDGIYVLDPADRIHGKIVRRSFTGRETQVGSYRVEHVYVNGRYPGGRLAVSPDESELLYVEYSRDGSSIHIVDDFC